MLFELWIVLIHSHFTINSTKSIKSRNPRIGCIGTDDLMAGSEYQRVQSTYKAHSYPRLFVLFLHYTIS